VPIGQPLRDEVKTVDAGTTDHPGASSGCGRLVVGFLCTLRQEGLQHTRGKALALASLAAGVELDALTGEAAAQISTPVVGVEHSLGRNAAIGVQDPVGRRKLDLAAGKEVRDLVRRGIGEFG
jgi:hypothetical protein